MEKKDKKYSPFLLVVLLVIYAGILFYFVQPILKANASLFYVPVETTYYDAIDGDFLMLKNETVFSTAKTTGSIKYEEGTRLRSGIIKAGVAENDEYYEISQRISELEDTKALFTSEITDIDKKLRKAIIAENYEDLKRLINSFGYKVLSGSTFNSALKIDQEINNLKLKLNSLSSTEVWNPAGIISFDMDGYEYLKIDDINTIKYEEFNDLINRVSMDINQNEFKIIDNFKALFVSYIPDNDKIRELNGKKIQISIDDQNTFLDAKLIVPETYDNEGIVGFLVTSHIEDIYKIRRGKISVVFNSMPSFRVPKNSIINYNDMMGIMVKDVNGIIRFRPIEIYKEQKDFYYISKGDERSNININGEDHRTVVFYEEIILNPNPRQIDTIY